MTTAPPPFDVTPAFAVLPFTLLALLAVALPALAYVTRRRRKAAHARLMPLACHGYASPTGCAFGPDSDCDPTGQCPFDTFPRDGGDGDGDGILIVTEPERPWSQVLAGIPATTYDGTGGLHPDTPGPDAARWTPESDADDALDASLRTLLDGWKNCGWTDGDTVTYAVDEPESVPWSIRYLPADDDNPPGVHIGTNGMIVRTRAVALQAAGPDEYPTGYYEHLARRDVGNLIAAEVTAADPDRPGAADGPGQIVGLLDSLNDLAAERDALAVVGLADLAAAVATPLDHEVLTGGSVTIPAASAGYAHADGTPVTGTVTVTPHVAAPSRLYVRDPEPADAPPEAAEPAWDADGYAPRPWDPDEVPSAQAWADWFVACAPHARLRIAGHVQDAFGARADCFEQNHDRRIAGLTAERDDLLAALTELRTADGDTNADLRDRLAATSNAAHEATLRADRAIAANQRLILDRDAARRAEREANAARREDRHEVIDLREQLAAAEARAADAVHDLDVARAALERAHKNHRSQYDRAEAEWERAEAAEARADEAAATAHSHWQTIGNLLDASRIHRKRGDDFRDRYNEAAAAHNRLLAEREARTGRATVRIDAAAFRDRLRDMLADLGVPTREEAAAVLADREVWHAAQHVGTVVPTLDSCPDGHRLTYTDGCQTSGAEALHAHRAAQIAVRWNRVGAEDDHTSAMIDRASDLPPAPEPIGTAAEWEARLEEWHDADQRAERDTVTSSRGLTYAVLHDAHCGYDDGGRPVIERRAVTPAYNDHDTVAATAAGA